MVGLLLLYRSAHRHPEPTSLPIHRDLAVVAQGVADVVLAAAEIQNK